MAEIKTLKVSIRLSLQLILLLLCLFIAFVFSWAPNHNILRGTWVGEFEAFEICFRFNQDNTFQFDWVNIESGISKKLTGDYYVDFSKKPIPLSLKNIPQLSYPLHTSIEFVGNNSLRINLFAPEWRRLRAISFTNDAVMKLSKE